MTSPTTAMSGDGRPEGLQDFVSRRLVRAIVSGDLPPGTRLSPARLAEELGVSHIPVREALAALEAVGHVQRIPRVGFFVAELSTDDIEDIYHWRQILEDEAHRIAIPRLDDADLARMREINDAMLKAAKERNDRFLGLNRVFHFVPFERAGSQHLLRFLTHLWDASARYQNAMAYVKVPKTLLQDHHNALMEAFEARDIDEVNAWMAKHRAVTLKAIREIHGTAASKSRTGSRTTAESTSDGGIRKAKGASAKETAPSSKRTKAAAAR
jgi:DNA-binding GntR family transcriptional regulator